MDSVRFLFFDTFGTVVDWRASVTNYLITQTHTTLSSSVTSIPSPVRLKASSMTPEDWSGFAQEWRESYYVFTRTYAERHPSSSEEGFVPIDHHFHDSLITLLEKHELTGFWPDDQVALISLIWHRLNPHPDSVRGLKALATKYNLSTLSNANKSLISNLATFGELPFHHLLCAEDFSAYKPDAKVYLGGAEKLGVHLEKGEAALVAAHLGDLKAAKSHGYRTVYLERKREDDWEPAMVEEAKREGWVDVWVGLESGDGQGKDENGNAQGKGEGQENRGMVEVARRLGCEIPPPS